MRDQQDTVRSQSDQIWRLDLALHVSEARNGALKAKLAKLLAEKKTLSKPIAGPQLRAALRRSCHQKKTITSLSEENRRLRRAVRASEALKTQAATGPRDLWSALEFDPDCLPIVCRTGSTARFHTTDTAYKCQYLQCYSSDLPIRPCPTAPLFVGLEV